MAQERWKPSTTVRGLSESAMFEQLTHAQLCVYVKLLGEAGRQRRRVLEIKNAKLWRDARHCQRVVRELEDLGLIRVNYEPRGAGRTIEVL